MFFCEVKEAVIGLFSSGRRANFSLYSTLEFNKWEEKKDCFSYFATISSKAEFSIMTLMCNHQKPIELHLLSHRVFIVKSITFSSSTVIREVAWGLLTPLARVSAPLWKPSANSPRAEQRCWRCTSGCERWPEKPYC